MELVFSADSLPVKQDLLNLRNKVAIIHTFPYFRNITYDEKKPISAAGGFTCRNGQASFR